MSQKAPTDPVDTRPCSCSSPCWSRPLPFAPPGGHLSPLAQVRLRLVPAIMGALCTQVVIISVLPDGSPGLHRLAARVVLRTRRRVPRCEPAGPGMWIVALGAALNLVAILANDGVMPASRSALRAAGIATNSPGFANSAAVAHPRLSNSATSSPSRSPWPLHNVFSIGDVCIAIGVMIAVLALSGSRLIKLRVSDGVGDAVLPEAFPAAEENGQRQTLL